MVRSFGLKKEKNLKIIYSSKYKRYMDETRIILSIYSYLYYNIISSRFKIFNIFIYTREYIGVNIKRLNE